MPTNKQLEEIVKNLEERVIKLEALKLEIEKPEKESEKEPEGEIKTETTEKKTEEELPVPNIPPKYREAINEVLNSRFGITINSVGDTPAFEMIISVPKEYSSLGDNEFQEAGGDLRSKIISFAGGLNEVRSYLQLVYTSFSPEVQAKIAADRLNA